MIKYLITVVLFLFTFSLIGQADSTIIVTDPIVPEIPDGVSKLSYFIASLGEFAIGAVLFFFKEAFKHIFSKGFNLRIFVMSNIKPFLWSVGGGVIILATIIFLPFLVPFLETKVGNAVSLDYKVLIISGGVLGAAIKGFISSKFPKKKDEKEA